MKLRRHNARHGEKDPWFFTTLLQDYRPATAALRTCQGLTALLAILPLLQWLGHPRLALAIANIGVLCGLVILMITSLSALPRRVQQPIPLSILLLYLAVYSTLNAWSPLIHLGWIQVSPMPYIGLAHAVLDGAVMSVLLQIRAHALQNEQQRTAWVWQHSRLLEQTEQRYLKDQSQLFDMLAHEIRTPLTTLRMWMNAKQLTRERLLRAVADMAQVIDRCIHTGQLADEGLKPDIQDIAPLELTLACIATCRSPDRVQFTNHRATSSLRTDAQMLTIALGNLLDNACKYSTPDSPILVTLHSIERAGRRGWQWEVVNMVSPTGAPEVEHLFKKYHRGNRARRVSGSGLGLFIVKGLLELMQGTVHYEARAGQAVFSLWVPEQPRSHRQPAMP